MHDEEDYEGDAYQEYGSDDSYDDYDDDDQD